MERPSRAANLLGPSAGDSYVEETHWLEAMERTEFKPNSVDIY